jgi:hypothetical protein
MSGHKDAIADLKFFKSIMADRLAIPGPDDEYAVDPRAVIELCLDNIEAEGFIRPDPDSVDVTIADDGLMTIKIPDPRYTQPMPKDPHA